MSSLINCNIAVTVTQNNNLKNWRNLGKVIKSYTVHLRRNLILLQDAKL